ncbi:hypothetical protein J6590_082853 [Homalodisca vitripennis]|nr:hypothetical protein J6590_082853 [Homalodisca vitripennis]
MARLPSPKTPRAITAIVKAAKVEATVIADLVGKDLFPGNVFYQLVSRITHAGVSSRNWTGAAALSLSVNG